MQQHKHPLSPDNLQYPGNIRNNGLWAQAEAYPSTASRGLPSSFQKKSDHENYKKYAAICFEKWRRQRVTEYLAKLRTDKRRLDNYDVCECNSSIYAGTSSRTGSKKIRRSYAGQLLVYLKSWRLCHGSEVEAVNVAQMQPLRESIFSFSSSFIRWSLAPFYVLSCYCAALCPRLNRTTTAAGYRVVPPGRQQLELEGGS